MGSDLDHELPNGAPLPDFLLWIAGALFVWPHVPREERNPKRKRLTLPIDVNALKRDLIAGKKTGSFVSRVQRLEHLIRLEETIGFDRKKIGSSRIAGGA